MPLASQDPLRLRPIALAVMLCASTAAFAQATSVVSGAPDELDLLSELTLEQLMDVEISSASKRVQRVSDAPSSVTVLTAEDFRTYGWKTLNDALRSVRGFYVTGDRNYTFIGLRGFQRPGDYNSRVLLLIDGYRTNDNIFDGALTGTDFALDIENIERIEIVRGPSSSLYGGNALFGAINVMTRSASSARGAEVSASRASFGTADYRASYGAVADNGLRLLVSGSHSESDGPVLRFPEDPATAGRPVADTDGDDHYRAFAKLEHDGLRVNVVHANRRKGITGNLYGTEIDPLNMSEDGISFIDTAYTRNLGAVAASGRIAYGEYRYRADYLYDPDGILKDRADGSWWTGELKLVASAGNHVLVAGADLQSDTRQDQQVLTLSPPSVDADERHAGERAGVYFQNDYAVLPYLTLSAGGRFDNYSGAGSQFSPRLAAILRQNASTVWKLLYGEAFRPPSAYERYYSLSGYQSRNPDLKPEEIRTLEAIVETQPFPRLRFTASAYRYRVENLINIGPDPANPAGIRQFQNLDTVDASGAEMELEYAWNGGARLRTSYAWQRAEDDNGTRLTNSPRQMAKLNASAPVWQSRIRVGAELQYTDRRRVDTTTIPSYTVTNLTLTSQRAWQGWQLSGSLYNLFDRRYSDPADIDVPGGRELLEQNGRTWRLKAAYRF
jgi:outer membrane receptor protein involved in Fe transport